jgi:hypothetical protein
VECFDSSWVDSNSSRGIRDSRRDVKGASEMMETLLAYFILGVFFVFVLAPAIAMAETNGNYFILVKVGVSILIAATVILGLIAAVFLAVEWAVSVF